MGELDDCERGSGNGGLEGICGCVLFTAAGGLGLIGTGVRMGGADGGVGALVLALAGCETCGDAEGCEGGGTVAPEGLRSLSLMLYTIA